MWKVILVGVAFTSMHLAYGQGKSLLTIYNFFKYIQLFANNNQHRFGTFTMLNAIIVQ